MATIVKDCKVQTMNLKTSEKGFTLIEVLVALAILGAIMTVTSAAVVILTRTSTQNNEWNFNLRQVQNAGHWISRDALMARVVVTPTPGHFPLNLSWSDWDSNDFNVDYVLNGNTLTRQLNVTHFDGSTDNSTLLIAEYIDPVNTTCTWNEQDNRLIVTIRASLNEDGGRFVERTYEIGPRLPGGG